MSSSAQTSDADAANTLVLAPAFENPSDACADHLGAAPPEETDVLFVTLNGTPDECLDRWRSDVALVSPANLGIVSVDESRSAAASTSATTQTAAGGHVRRVSSPGDLTGLGIAISQYLSEWHGTDNRSVVCFDSVTTLLQYADTQRVFQFLHVLTRRIEEAGATAHFHMDPSAHDDRTVRTIASLFDEIVGETDDYPQ